MTLLIMKNDTIVESQKDANKAFLQTWKISYNRACLDNAIIIVSRLAVKKKTISIINYMYNSLF